MYLVVIKGMVDLQLKFHMMLGTRNDLIENDLIKNQQINETTVKTNKTKNSKTGKSDKSLDEENSSLSNNLETKKLTRDFSTYKFKKN